MTPYENQHPVLSSAGMRAFSLHALFLLGAAWLLPAAAHLTGISVRALLPMHWPVLLVGLCYGWRSGAVIGLTAPVVSYLFSGMPVPAILPSMTIELAVYGLLAGATRESWGLGFFQSITIAIVGGRFVFLVVASMTGAITMPFATYLQAAMLPGLPAAAVQFITLPLMARWYIAHEQQRKT